MFRVVRPLISQATGHRSFHPSLFINGTNHHGVSSLNNDGAHRKPIICWAMGPSSAGSKRRAITSRSFSSSSTGLSQLLQPSQLPILVKSFNDIIGDGFKGKSHINEDTILLTSLHEDVSLNMKQLREQITQVQHGIMTMTPWKRGDSVALWSFNSSNGIVFMYALLSLGIRVVSLNPTAKEKELEFFLNFVEAKGIIFPGDQPQQSQLHPFSTILHHVTPKLKEKPLSISFGSSGGDITMDAIVKAGRESKKPFHRQSIDPEDVGIVMYTSGTTGTPKAVMLSHSTLINNATFVSHRLGYNHQGVKVLVPIPLFHVFGTVYGSINMAVSGVPIILTGYKYSVSKMVKALHDHQCTHANIVPTMTSDIVSYLESHAGTHNVDKLQTIVTGSAPTAPGLVQMVHQKLPTLKHFYIRYGSTETGGCMTLPLANDPINATYDNVGLPLDHCTVRVTELDTTKVLPLGEKGMVWMKGPNVMKGYYKNPEKTKEDVVDGWFKTGDVGFLDTKTKRLTLSGRQKEIIIRGGENIFPLEIEEILLTHPDVELAFVVGVPDERMGEELVACIRPKANRKVTPDQLKQFVTDNLADFKSPKYVMFPDQIPMTPKGSPIRREITDMAIDLFDIRVPK